MKHPTNRDLFAYWNRQRGENLAPPRNDIEPSAIRKLLGDTFVLSAGAGGIYTFRLAGTRLCAMFGRELKSETFASLWDKPWQTSMRELIHVVMDEKAGVVACASGTAAKDTMLPLKLELLLLPLANEAREDARLIGALVPMEAPYWLGARALGPLSLGMFRHVGPAVEEVRTPRLVSVTGRIGSHGFTVYEGGRAE